MHFAAWQRSLFSINGGFFFYHVTAGVDLVPTFTLNRQGIQQTDRN